MSGGPTVVFTPGMKLETDRDGLGSIGCFAHPAGQASQRLLLSCGHVLFSSAWAGGGGINVYSPPSSSSWCRHHKIGVTRGLFQDGFHRVRMRVTPQGQAPHDEEGYDTDAAVALVEPNVRFENKVPGIGPIAGTPPGGLGFGVTPEGQLPQPDHYVRFYSPFHQTVNWGTPIRGTFAAAQYLEGGSGQVPSPLLSKPIRTTEDELADALPNLGCFIVIPRPPPDPATFMPQGSTLQQYYQQHDGPSGHPLFFGNVESGGGDSGSVVLNRQNQVVGLLIRAGIGSPFDNSNAIEHRNITTFGLVCPIRPVLEKLQIEIPGGGWSPAAPSAGAAVAFPSEAYVAALERGIEEVEEELSRSPVGALVLAKVREHGREGRRLVNTVRRVTLTWHRAKGPAFLHHAIESLRDPEHRIPRSIDSVTWRDLLAEMAVVLESHGSDELRADVAHYAPLVSARLSDLTSLRDAPALLGEARLP